MSVVPGMNRRIKDALVTILGGLQYGGEPAFTAVLDNTHDEFDGGPVARVLPSGYRSMTATNAERDHVVSYTVIISWPLEDPSNVEADLYNAMYDLTNVVADSLEHDDVVGELSTLDPTIQNWMMNVPDVKWRLAAGKVGALLLCEITVQVSYSQDIW